ncbi:M3 family metallopeptidase [Paeniglutamicibacter antarcticus]|uniref:M3 family metallopeptidase n=1 Tax=Arthrobacter terrae TaxID=2935737 RepID=A0A931CNT4_9MICC|nr:M3 family metallopeptidase [Arthrobacter terrae]MBG0741618.1 M3 family metallopeptidase [Arthrobacter terrae]
MTVTSRNNPFLSVSTLPYGLPDFASITDEDFLPAFEAGFSGHLAEIAGISSTAEPATFENTVLAMERSGQLLSRVAAVFFNNSSSDATAEIQELETVVSPKFAAHADNIYLDASLYQRFLQVDTEGLDDESVRLVEEYRKAFRRAGADLAPAAQSRSREINEELSSLGTEFSHGVLKNTNDAALLVQDAAELAGLPEEDIASAAEAAKTAGHDSGYLLTLILPTAQPALEFLTDRATRRRLFEASIGRGDGVGSADILPVAARMAALRAERAALLGFDSHAAFVTDDETAPSLDAVQTMLARLAPAAVANARTEADVLTGLAEAGGHSLEPWDWAFYSAQVRRDKYDVDLASLRPYFEFERVLRDGVFAAATRLYGITFQERPDLHGYHPEVRVWEVFNADGSGLGLFLGDYYTRDSKNGGAWMNPLVEQSALLNLRSVVVNNLNISKPPVGEPTLLTYDEVVTCFHEFGHALHGLFSEVTYPRFSGTNVPRDFVEYPSQVNEMWILWPEIVQNYARHYQSDEPLPARTVAKLEDARLWGEGFATTEYLGAALLDLAWHSLPPGSHVADPLGFEAQALSDAGVSLRLVPPRYRTGYFKHIFAGGYSAGYYAYIWSEVLDADTVEWFKSNGGLTRSNGDHFRSTLLARGNSADPLESFRNFRGRDAALAPLLTRRGLS